MNANVVITYKDGHLPHTIDVYSQTCQDLEVSYNEGKCIYLEVKKSRVELSTPHINLGGIGLTIIW